HPPRAIQPARDLSVIHDAEKGEIKNDVIRNSLFGLVNAHVHEVVSWSKRQVANPNRYRMASWIKKQSAPLIPGEKYRHTLAVRSFKHHVQHCALERFDDIEFNFDSESSTH